MSKIEEVMKKVSRICIDYDDTLADVRSVLVKKLDGFCAMNGRDVTDILLREIHDGRIHNEFPERHSDIEFHAKLLLDRLDVIYDKELVEKVAGKITEAFEESISEPMLFKDSFSFLSGARECGLHLYLTTAKSAAEKVRSIERNGHKKYFVAGYDEGILNQIKLDPGFYEEVLRRTLSVAAETVCIGDSLLDDVIPAKRAGIRTIWLNRLGMDDKDQHEADFQVRSLSEVLLLLKKLNEESRSSEVDEE